jgi:DNA-directed RNA polymerase specialized sigma24 family protein
LAERSCELAVHPDFCVIVDRRLENRCGAGRIEGTDPVGNRNSQAIPVEAQAPITGREEDIAGAQLSAPAAVPEYLTDGDILAGVDSLPLQFREVVLLVDVEDFSYKEASEILRVPIGTIMSRLSRARGILKAKLADVARSYGVLSAGA